MRTSSLFGTKNSEFFEIYGVSARQGEGVSQCGHFADKGGVNFSGFCADVFYERLLMARSTEKP